MTAETFMYFDVLFFFFFQAEDGIRDFGVTGVQTCALPIYRQTSFRAGGGSRSEVSATGDRRKCQTYTASPAEPGGLPVMLGLIITALSFLCVVWFSISPAFSVIPLALAALAFAPLSEDAALYLTPFAVFLCALNRGVPRSLASALVVCLAVPALAKFSCFLLSVTLL